ncbi:MAG: PilZ domain-containing protein, partial [Desulfobacterales bacterium]
MAESSKVKRELTVSFLASELIDAVLNLSPEHQRELLAELRARKGVARRKYSRRPYRHEVQFSVDGKLFTGFIKNVSDGGAFVETMRSDLGRLDRGRQVTMSFEHPVNQ